MKRLETDGYKVMSTPMSPEDDNKYAVDFLIYQNGQLICGVQIKSENYHKSHLGIVHSTIKTNERKNEKFVRDYGVPVFYAFYKRVESNDCALADETVIEEIENLLQK